jgi:hypothetical protein
MKSVLIATLACVFLTTNFANAADSSCEAQAAQKKLAGAAKDSFLKKCNKNVAAPAKASCESQAAEKKLAGAAKNSFVKKCETDAAAAPK